MTGHRDRHDPQGAGVSPRPCARSRCCCALSHLRGVTAAGTGTTITIIATDIMAADTMTGAAGMGAADMAEADMAEAGAGGKQPAPGGGQRGQVVAI